MMADLLESKPRRKVVTYGKRPRAQHDIFSQSSPQKESTHSQAAFSATSEADQAPRSHKIARESEVARKGHVLDRPAQTAGPSTLLGASKITANARGTLRADAQKVLMRQSEDIDSSTYDISSSDEGDGAPRFPESLRKRRKVTPASESLPLSRLRLSPPKRLPQERQRLTAKAAPKRSIADKGSTHAIAKPQGVVVQSKLKSRSPPSKVPATALRSPSISPVGGLSRSPSVLPMTPPRHIPRIEEFLSSERKSSKSIPTPKGTPRQAARLNDLLDKQGVTSTPSLGLGRLRVTSAGTSPDDPPSDTDHRAPIRSKSNTPRLATSRTRLIDALGTASLMQDVLLSDDDSNDVGAGDMDVDHSGSMAKSKPDQTLQSTDIDKTGQLKAYSASQPAQATGPKVTYAKQRSYLSDMLGDDALSLPKASSSQRSQFSAPIPSSQPDNFEMKMMDIEEDDALNGGGGIRSIHELRKAGETARFQVSLESSFEDIEAKDASRGRRVSGYMQLGLKLQDHDLRSQFLIHAMDRRLMRHQPAADDIVLQSLRFTAYALLLCDNQATLRTVQSIHGSARSQFLNMLRETRTLDKIAAERRQNLSKAVRKDLFSFQLDTTQSVLWKEQQITALSPELIALRLLEAVVRRAQELAEPSFSLPLPVVQLLVDSLLDAPSTPNTVMGLDSMCRMELIVSILESYTIDSANLDDSTVQSLAKLAELGPVLTMLSSSSNDRCRQMQHLVLRLILNVTNNNPVFCNAFAKAPLVTAVLHIISQDFIRLVSSDVGDNPSHVGDAVVLALGVAINFAEWSEHARSLMSTISDLATSLMDQLTALFLENKDAASEISNTGESQRLVAFGYLSVLLSVLCMDEGARRRVRSKFPGGRLRPLIDAVEMFLGHFRKVDEEAYNSGGPGEMSYRDFTERFGQILDRVTEADARD